LKGEDRELVLLPRHLRARRIPRGLRLSFALPRGGYALLVVQRMLAESGASSERRPRSRPPDSRSPGSRSTRPRQGGRKPPRTHGPKPRRKQP
jgi:hypothetical protein